MTGRSGDLRQDRRDPVVVIVIRKARTRRRKGERVAVSHPPDPGHVIETRRVAEDDDPPVLHLKNEIHDVEINLEIDDHEADQSLARDKAKDRDPERDLLENTRRSDIRTSLPSS